MTKKISILGSTGSIGLSTLDIVRRNLAKFRVAGLSAKSNAKILFEQAREFRPSVVCIYQEALASDLETRLKPLGIRVVTGDQGLVELATMPAADQIICAMVGVIGLKPIFAGLNARKTLAIANKEPLVVAGKLLMKLASDLGVKVLPIDSEHSGLWQCLEGHPRNNVKKLILTTSGGPFRNQKGSLKSVTLAQALKHPKWKMGPKITIDSATLMNKGLEVIEAANLFDVPASQIEVLVHPEALVHALVEFIDGSLIAQMGITDMRLPIQYALSYPERLNNHLPPLDFKKANAFHFEMPDLKRFPCLRLGYEASAEGGTMPAVLNAANEISVDAFLNQKIGYTRIASLIEEVMEAHSVNALPDMNDLLEADRWARELAHSLTEGPKRSSIKKSKTKKVYQPA